MPQTCIDRHQLIKRMITTILVTTLIAMVVFSGLIYLFQERLIFFPTRRLDVTPQEIELAYEDVYLTTSDGLSLHGWWIPADQARGVLLHFHGNAGNISHRLELIHIFHQLRLNVLIFDYRGYGKSQGKPSEAGTYKDAEAAWQYLTVTRHIPPDQIVLHGQSLGGAVAAWLAGQQSPRALILESTFSSVVNLGQELYPFLPVRWLARVRYPTIERVPKISCPIQIIHAKTDEIIPFDHARLLFTAAPEPKSFLELRGGHNDGFIMSGARYIDGLNMFLAQSDSTMSGRNKY